MIRSPIALLVLLLSACASTGPDGLLRLIAPEESHPARRVRQVEDITVVAAP